MAEKGAEEAERTVVEHNLKFYSSNDKAHWEYLSLLVSAGDDVSDGAKRRSLKFDFGVAEQEHQLWNDVRIDDLSTFKIMIILEQLICNFPSQVKAYHLNLLVAAISEVRERPDGVDENGGVLVLNQLAERGQKLAYSC